MKYLMLLSLTTIVAHAADQPPKDTHLQTCIVDMYRTLPNKTMLESTIKITLSRQATEKEIKRTIIAQEKLEGDITLVNAHKNRYMFTIKDHRKIDDDQNAN